MGKLTVWCLILFCFERGSLCYNLPWLTWSCLGLQSAEVQAWVPSYTRAFENTRLTLKLKFFTDSRENLLMASYRTCLSIHESCDLGVLSKLVGSFRIAKSSRRVSLDRSSQLQLLAIISCLEFFFFLPYYITQCYFYIKSIKGRRWLSDEEYLLFEIVSDTSSLSMQKSQSGRIKTSWIKRYLVLMGLLCSRVAPRGSRKLPAQPPGGKREDHVLTFRGSSLNRLGDWSWPPLGRGQGLAGYSRRSRVQGHTGYTQRLVMWLSGSACLAGIGPKVRCPAT